MPTLTSLPSARLIHCTFVEHAEPIREIFNEAILNTTALYDYEPRTPAQMRAWFEEKVAGQFPVLGVVDERGRLMGLASYGTFRARPAYKYSVEHSVYVHRDHRGRGLGRLLMQALIEQALDRQLHLLVGGIDAANEVSIALHRSLGFVHAGTIREAGFKFGRWLDLAFYQLLLSTPSQPVDG